MASKERRYTIMAEEEDERQRHLAQAAGKVTLLPHKAHRMHKSGRMRQTSQTTSFARHNTHSSSCLPSLEHTGHLPKHGVPPCDLFWQQGTNLTRRCWPFVVVTRNTSLVWERSCWTDAVNSLFSVPGTLDPITSAEKALLECLDSVGLPEP